jgi:hypothetical protein
MSPQYPVTEVPLYRNFIFTAELTARHLPCGTDGNSQVQNLLLGTYRAVQTVTSYLLQNLLLGTYRAVQTVTCKTKHDLIFNMKQIDRDNFVRVSIANVRWRTQRHFLFL